MQNRIKNEVFSSFSEYMKRYFPKLYEKEQNAKKSIADQLWDILKEGEKQE